MNGRALAVFVKTPGRSPVKTRLAAQVGEEAALAVYAECLWVMRRRMREVAAAGVRVCWAVAEEAAVADGDWDEFEALWTGEGGLGRRLGAVYSALRGAGEGGFGRVALVGADCPQVTAEAVVGALGAGGTVVGPAADGGFYLFASGAGVPMRVWEAPVYGAAGTLEGLEAALAALAVEGGGVAGGVVRLGVLSDVDDVESLARCVGEFEGGGEGVGLARLLAEVVGVGGGR